MRLFFALAALALAAGPAAAVQVEHQHRVTIDADPLADCLDHPVLWAAAGGLCLYAAAAWAGLAAGLAALALSRRAKLAALLILLLLPPASAPAQLIPTEADRGAFIRQEEKTLGRPLTAGERDQLRRLDDMTEQLVRGTVGRGFAPPAGAGPRTLAGQLGEVPWWGYALAAVVLLVVSRPRNDRA